ncbi:hypothetical protein BHM03_00023263 [Ensete ventricosum]|nr:hypothetical protein BHM03_00023263 [Ensete ventricosum]
MLSGLTHGLASIGASLSNRTSTVHFLARRIIPTNQRRMPPTSTGSKAGARRSITRNGTAYQPEREEEAVDQMEMREAEIAFFDLETSVPGRGGGGNGFSLLEFGAILLCPRRLVEVGSYSTLIRPADLGVISTASVRCNGITRDAVATAPYFRDVADNVFNILNGRVWAGHNILRFDCPRIREAFAEIGRPAPEPRGIIDTLPLLTKNFGRRAGDMKVLFPDFRYGYFGVLLRSRKTDTQEASLPDVFSVASLEYNHTASGTEANGNTSADQSPNSSVVPFSRQQKSDLSQVILEPNDRAGSSMPISNGDPSALVSHMEQMKIDSLQTEPACNFEIPCATTPASENSSSLAGFLKPDEVLPQQIRAPTIQGSRRTSLLHGDCPLQLCCTGMRIHFGVSSKFMDYAGRPKLSIVVDAPENLCKVLDVCDQVARISSENSGSNSEWRPLLKKNDYSNTFTIRLHIPTVANGDGVVYSTEIYQKDPRGNLQNLELRKLDAAELDRIFLSGTAVDACFSTDIYDYQQNAGIRLVARRLVVHSR